MANLIDDKFNVYLLSVQDWPIQRTLHDCKTHCTAKATEQRKGAIHEPLLFIPFDHVIIDTLHLFLRIMGLLFHQVSFYFQFEHTGTDPQPNNVDQ